MALFPDQEVIKAVDLTLYTDAAATMGCDLRRAGCMQTVVDILPHFYMLYLFYHTEFYCVRS